MARVRLVAVCLSQLLSTTSVGGFSEACVVGADQTSCPTKAGTGAVAAARMGALSDHLMIQVRVAANKRDARNSSKAPSCCTSCGLSQPFCSPVSGTCYKTKRRDYYESCPAVHCEGEDCPLGWVPVGAATSGTGQWCEVGQPSSDWSSLKSCPIGNGSLPVKVLTYNLFWWNLFNKHHGEGGRAGKKIATTSGPEEYDFLGFQECDDITRVMRDAKSHGLAAEYGTLDGGRALGMAYLKSRWTLLSSGKEDVGEDSRKQWYGKRSAQWARLQHRSDGAIVFFMNHHGPLPISEGGGCTGSATAYNMMRVIAENAHAGDSIVVVGDFNAKPDSSRVQTLSRYMHRVFTGSAHGGVDHIFSNCHGAAVTSTKNIGSGGSDHDALNAVFQIPALGKAPSVSPGPVAASTTTSTTVNQVACCASCVEAGFCSPVSGNCYDNKAKHYYEVCAMTA